MRFEQLLWITKWVSGREAALVFNLINTSLPQESGLFACISSRITTVIEVVREYNQINDNWFDESQYKCLYLDMYGLIFETSIWCWQDQPVNCLRKHKQKFIPFGWNVLHSLLTNTHSSIFAKSLTCPLVLHCEHYNVSTLARNTGTNFLRSCIAQVHANCSLVPTSAPGNHDIEIDNIGTSNIISRTTNSMTKKPVWIVGKAGSAKSQTLFHCVERYFEKKKKLGSCTNQTPCKLFSIHIAFCSWLRAALPTSLLATTIVQQQIGHFHTMIFLLLTISRWYQKSILPIF